MKFKVWSRRSIRTVTKLTEMITPQLGRRLVLVIGVPASGKSTMAAALEKAGYFRVSRDQIRGELYGDRDEFSVSIRKARR